MKCDDIVYEAANAFLHKEYDKFKYLVNTLYTKYFPDVKVVFYPVKNTNLDAPDVIVTVLPTKPLTVVVYYETNSVLKDDDVFTVKNYILSGLVLIYRAKKIPVKISDRLKNFLNKRNIIFSLVGALFLSPIYLFISKISKKKTTVFLVLELLTFFRILYEISKFESDVILNKIGCELFYVNIDSVIKKQQEHLKEIERKIGGINIG